MVRRFALLIVILLAISSVHTLASPRPAYAGTSNNPSQDSGWRRANVVGGGCNTTGSCRSGVSAGAPTLYEYVPLRDPVGQNEPPGGAAHGGDGTAVARQECNYNGQILGWAKGTWHFGATWSYSIDAQGRKTWSGPIGEHWAFEHNDDCPPKLPTLTPTPQPTAEPGQPTYTPLPTAPPATVTPTIEVPLDPCQVERGDFDNRLPLPIYVTATNYRQLSAREYSWQESNPNYDYNGQGSWFGGDWLTPPDYDLGPQFVEPNQPLAITYDWSLLEDNIINKLAYQADHNGQARVRFGLKDLTTGMVLLNADTRQIKPLLDVDGNERISGYTLQLTDVSVAASLNFTGTMVFWSWRQTNGGAFDTATYRPITNKYVKDLAPSSLTFIPQEGHTYEAWSVAGHGACHLEAPRWVRAQFTAQAGPINPPTPTPTPPTPPTPNATFRISLHSTLDPNSADSDDRNGVYVSTGNQIAWPAGEVLDFTPRVQIVLDPPAPAYSGYAFRAYVTGWSYIGSLDQRADLTADALGRSGCRARDLPNDPSGLNGCAYRYIGGASLTDATEPTEADMDGQAHVYWAVGKPLSMRPDVYVYSLSKLQPVDLAVQVRIAVEVVNVATGQVVATQHHAPTATFGVALVAPRSAR